MTLFQKSQSDEYKEELSTHLYAAKGLHHQNAQAPLTDESHHLRGIVKEKGVDSLGYGA